MAGVVAFAGALGGFGSSPFSASPGTPALDDDGVAVPTGAPARSIDQIGALAAGAGFRGPGLVMAIAVALAESRGDPRATDFDSNGTVDRGVWQINSVHTEYSVACDYDPPCAAAATFVISQGGSNWGAWVTYQHGAEIPFLPQSVAYVETSRASPGSAGRAHPSSPDAWDASRQSATGGSR
jgi:hypothetical protein